MGSIEKETESGKVRLLVADPLFGDRLSLDFAASDDEQVEVVGLCASALSAARVADQSAPSVIVVDTATPAPEGTDVIRLLHALCPDARIVVWANGSDAGARDQAFADGASVVLPKATDPVDVIEHAKRAVAEA